MSPGQNRAVRHALRHLRKDSRGASLVEYIVIVGLIAVVVIAGVTVFGKKAKEKAEAQADCITSLSGCKGGDASAEPGGRPRGNQSEPPFDKVKNVGETKYVAVDGTPFSKGKDDPAAIHPKDISQGQLGDCWFMSSMAAIAKRNPDIIKNGIQDLGGGKYKVTLYDNCWYCFRSDNKVEVIVTSDFPQKGGGFRFAQPGSGDGVKPELWPLLYEKALAQQRGGYDKLVGGWGREGMEAITGAKSSSYSPSGLTFDKFAALFDKNAVTMGTISKGAAKEKIPFKNGTLYAEHEYYVDSIDREKQTVTVRNPWGWNNAPITLTWAEAQAAFGNVDVNPAP